MHEAGLVPKLASKAQDTAVMSEVGTELNCKITRDPVTSQVQMICTIVSHPGYDKVQRG